MDGWMDRWMDEYLNLHADKGAYTLEQIDAWE